MKVCHGILGSIVAVVAVCPLGAQTPVLGSLEAPYPAIQSTVHVAGGVYGPGAVAYGAVGTPLVLTGSDLGTSGTVQFVGYKNGAPDAGYTVQATVSMWQSDMIFFTVPSGAVSGLVTVTVEGKTSTGLPFIVTPGTYAGSCPTSPSNSQLQITTASLHDGMAGQAYSATLSAAGGTAPYTWSIANGALPSGLSLTSSGAISGTPTGAASPVDVTFQVADRSTPPQTNAAVLSLTIQPQALTPVSGIYQFTANSYDGAGNLTSYSDSTYNSGNIMGSWNFTYDTLNRLMSGQATSGNFAGQYLCWSYDSFGNRTAQSLQTSACPTPETNVPSTAHYNANNQVTWVQNSAMSGFGYDAAGDVTADSINSYLYDGDGRVCAVKSTPLASYTTMTEYIYDAEGRRVAKGTISTMSCDPTSNGFQLTASYVLDEDGSELTQQDGSGNWQRTNVYVASKLLATYDLNGLHFHLTDPLGTRRIQVSGNLNTIGVPDTDIQSLPYGDALYTYPDPYAPPTADDATPLHFTGKERDSESGNDYFGARYYASTMGRFLSPDPAGVAFSDVSDPQSWNLYAYARNNPLVNIDPDGRECVWDDGSFDSMDDPQTGSISGCENAGGTYYDPSTFTAGNGQDWSASPNAELAAQVAEGQALAASLPQGPDPNSATGGNSSTNGNTTTVDLWGLNWFSSQVNTGTHPWRDNNPGDIISGPFTGRNGQLGTDGRFAVFPTSGTGSQAMNTLLSEPGYQNLSINAAVAKYAPAFENNTASYQQFLINAVGVSGNTPLSSLSSSQMQTLENAISRYEGYDARGNFSVTTTSVITPP